MQQLWKEKSLEWDDQLSQQTSEHWKCIFQDLEGLNEIVVERCLKESGSGMPELHIFSDASSNAYGACAYVKHSSDSRQTVYLIAAKARVAPLKQATIPRLELMGALLASRLARTIYAELRDKPQVYLWTDSQVVLRWLNSESTSKKPFVGVRVAEIQAEWDTARWRFVPTKLNPADDLSRGVKVADIGRQWFYGPQFLQEPKNCWPEQPEYLQEHPQKDEEDKIIKHPCSSVVRGKTFIDAEKFSRWSRLVRVTAYCFRFIENLKKKLKDRSLSPSLSTEEKQRAEVFWIQECQKQMPDWEKRAAELSPFVEKDGIVRVGGRMKHSELTYDQIYPVLLPASSHIAKLILREIYENVFHAGIERTLSESRRRYWVIHGRNVVKDIVRKCTVCRKLRQPPHTTLMGDLPDNGTSFVGAQRELRRLFQDGRTEIEDFCTFY